MEFFRDEVERALNHQKVKTSEEAAFYLVHLLSDFAKAEKLYSTNPHERRVDEPLALMLHRAVESPPLERQSILKKMGDVALYIAGFFEESLNKKLVDIHYYVSMGGGAYRSLSTSLSKATPVAQLFNELSAKFVPFTDILAEVSHHANIRSDSNLLIHYEKWLKTGSDRARQILWAEGIVPQSIDPKTTH